jgi:hypothetical protein
MLAADRRYFEKYAVDPDNEGFMFEMSTVGWDNDSGDKEIGEVEWLDEDWTEVE